MNNPSFLEETLRAKDLEIQNIITSYTNLQQEHEKLKHEYQQQQRMLEAQNEKINKLQSDLLLLTQVNSRFNDETSDEEQDANIEEETEDQNMDMDIQTNKSKRELNTSPETTQPPKKMQHINGKSPKLAAEAQLLQQVISNQRNPPNGRPDINNKQAFPALPTNSTTTSQKAITNQNSNVNYQNHHSTQIAPHPQNSNQNQSEKYVPPIILRDASIWNHISLHLKENQINYDKAQSLEAGIKITPSRVEDYRKIIRYLDNNNFPYHTYQLPEEKNLHIVIRGVPTNYSNDEIKAELQNKGFNPITTFRMTNRNKQPTPLALALIPRNEGHIYKLTNIFGLSVKIESLKNNTKNNQCRNCQLFGHGQTHCKAPPRCLKCGSNHHTMTCNKPRDVPATCANCAGPHPANYRGCPKHPENIQNRKKQQAQTNALSQSTYASATAAKSSNPPQHATTATRQQTINTTLINTNRNQHTHSQPITEAIRSIQLFAQQFSQMAMQLSNTFAPILTNNS